MKSQSQHFLGKKKAAGRLYIKRPILEAVRKRPPFDVSKVFYTHAQGNSTKNSVNKKGFKKVRCFAQNAIKGKKYIECCGCVIQEININSEGLS